MTSPRAAPTTPPSRGENRDSRILSWLYILVSAIYLLTEVYFNLTLQDVIADPNATKERIHFIEEFGRLASSAGFTLFVLGLFLYSRFQIRSLRDWIVYILVIATCLLPTLLTPYISVKDLLVIIGGIAITLAANAWDRSVWLRPLASFAGLVLMAGPAFYYGKVALTDHFIVDQSSPAERQAAQYTAYLKKGLLTGVVDLEDISLKSFKDLSSPEAKAFLVMFGPVALSSENLKGWIDNPNNIRLLSEAIVSRQAAVDIKQEYDRFLKRRESFLSEYYTPYEEASRNYLNRVERLPDEASKAWLELQQEIDQGWLDYEVGQTKFKNHYLILARDQVAPSLQDFFEQQKKCGQWQSCLENMEAKYKARMQEIIGPPPPSAYFCYNAAIVKSLNDLGYALESTLRSIFTLGTKACDLSAKSVGKKLYKANRDKFREHESNPASLTMGLTRKKYFQSPDLRKYLIWRLREKDIQLPGNWDYRDQKAFYSSFEASFHRHAHQEWQARTTERLGAEISAGLSFNQFVAAEIVQQKIRSELGERYVDDYAFSWSEREFRDLYLIPNIERALKKELGEFQSRTSSYADHRSNEEMGKDFYRAAVIPPIAVALSLIFSFLSALKIITFAGLKVLLASPRNTLLVRSFSAILAVGVFSSPYLMKNDYADSKAWSILKSEVSENSYTIGNIAEYVLRLEPMLATIGKPILQHIAPLCMESFQPPNPKSKEAIKSVQKKLGLKVDGILGPKTQTAIDGYRSENNLGPGRIDARLLEHIAEDSVCQTST